MFKFRFLIIKFIYFEIILASPSHVPASASLSAIFVADSASNTATIDFLTFSGKSSDGYLIAVSFGNIIIS